MKPTLLILAAGMGSRYGGIKQMDAFGPAGETIIDYSIYDAINSGFGKIVFVIRKDFAVAFKELFEAKLNGKIATEYVMQEMDEHLEGFPVPEGRTKPWGTAHAILCAKEVINEPFAVINADDFYGRDAFQKAADFLTNEVTEKKYCIIGYELSKTLSANGTVSRGVCATDTTDNLVNIHERTKIYPEGDKIYYEENSLRVVLPQDTPVSMNFWGFHPNVFDFIQKLFGTFLKENAHDLKAEFFIPLVGDAFINDGDGEIKVIPTSAQWFGVTYKDDAPGVRKSLQKLISDGVYPTDLWNS
ncbi:MAG: sugar phosphate nucleotidyltransferase [Ginsengibacter sp.]